MKKELIQTFVKELIKQEKAKYILNNMISQYSILII